MALHTYDASQVNTVFAGIPIAGTPDGKFLEIDYNDDAFKLTVGTNGDACRSKSNNRSAKIDITLGQWDQVNLALSALFNLDINSPNGDGIGPLMVKDNSGLSMYFAAKCWIKKPANVTFDREAKERTWNLETNELTVYTTGGN